MQAGEVTDLLALNTAHAKYQYLNRDFYRRSVQAASIGGLLGQRQIADAWLLATAIRYKTKRVMFDVGIVFNGAISSCGNWHFLSPRTYSLLQGQAGPSKCAIPACTHLRKPAGGRWICVYERFN